MTPVEIRMREAGNVLRTLRESRPDDAFTRLQASLRTPLTRTPVPGDGADLVLLAEALSALTAQAEAATLLHKRNRASSSRSLRRNGA
jgi:hypothetical protein